MKKIYFMFIVTFIICIGIFLYKPRYLKIYKDTFTIKYNFKEEGYKWNYFISNNILTLESKEEDKWVFKPRKNGETTIVYIFSNEKEVKYKIIYKLKIRGNKIYWLSGEGFGLFEYPNPY